MQGVKDERSVWDMTYGNNVGSNVMVVLENDDCKVLKVNGNDGDGIMTMYQVFDGVYLIYNDYHMGSFKSEDFFNPSILCIDHCREGRIEMSNCDGSLYYIEKGDMCIGGFGNHTGEFHFPLSHYHGITIGFQDKYAEESIKREMPGFSIDLPALIKKYMTGKATVIHNDPSVEHLFYQLYELPGKVHREYFKVKVIELLIYLSGMESEEYKVERPYFYASQVEKVKAVHELITSDLTKGYTLAELSRKFSISLTALKKCFKSTYGKPIYAYLKEIKMNRASELLITRRELKVSEIGAMVGYESASKFTAVFHEMMGQTPLEYRKYHGLER